jgi:hypothetical protein
MSLAADKTTDGLDTLSARRLSRDDGDVAGPDTLPERPLNTWTRFSYNSV